MNVQLRYRNFILDLYHASPIDGYIWLHGIKAGRLVHVGTVDAPISLGEVKAIVNESESSAERSGWGPGATISGSGSQTP